MTRSHVVYLSKNCIGDRFHCFAGSVPQYARMRKAFRFDVVHKFRRHAAGGAIAIETRGLELLQCGMKWISRAACFVPSKALANLIIRACHVYPFLALD